MPPSRLPDTYSHAKETLDALFSYPDNFGIVRRELSIGGYHAVLYYAEALCDTAVTERVIAFCKGIQAAAPVDSYVSPEPWAMPGYDSDVIMAAGAFVQGSSIELSADGPVKEPFAVYFQGGLTWYHAKFGILMSLQKLYERKLVELD